MQAEDEEDSDGLGVVGYPSEQLKTEALFWRLVCSFHLPKDEIDSWTLGEMRLAAGYQAMQNDYKRVWQPYYEMKKDLS